MYIKRQKILENVLQLIKMILNLICIINENIKYQHNMVYTKYLYRKADTEEEDVSYNTSTYSCSDGVQKYQEGSTYHSQDLVHVKGTPHEDTSYQVKGFFQGNAPAHFRIILFFQTS